MLVKGLFQFELIKLNYKYIFKLVAISFLLPPVISLPYAVYSLLKSKDNSIKPYFTLFAVFASYMAVINAGKMPTSDQSNYWAVYMQVPKEGLIWAMNHIYGFRDATNGKEFMNGIYNYVGYYLTGGCYGLYIYINTILMYLPFYYCIYKMFEGGRNVKKAVLCGVICLSFFNQFFLLTIHLQRQFIAYSMIIYLMILKATTGKTNILLILIAFFTHTTAILFIPFLYFDLLYRRLSPKRMALIGILVVGALVFVSSFIGNESVEVETNALNYSLQRIKNAGGDDVKFKLFEFLAFNFPMVFIALTRMFQRGLKPLEYIVYNTYIFLFVFVVSMSGNELVQYRFSFFTYGYMGMIFPMFCYENRNVTNLYYPFISLFFIVRFYLTFDNSNWTYDPIWKSLLIPEIYNTLNVGYGDISKFLIL